jgi:muramoyltetrapeptide carboxypeptidase
MMRIGIVAPACPLDPAVADGVRVLAAEQYGPALELVIHPQCYLSEGHFAGPDAARAEAFVEMANDPSLDAIWFARGGYGSNRIVFEALDRLGDAARTKIYLGYSDMGFLLAGLCKRGIGRPVHGPMVSDFKRSGGEAAVLRALDWLVTGDLSHIEPAARGRRAMAFNMTVLGTLLGTPLQPDFTDCILMLEDVDEHHYRLDRTLFGITANPSVQRCAGLMLGRCAPIPENDRPFGMDEDTIAQHWCTVSGIPWLGRADIGHDVGNKIVPFPA